MQSKIGNFRDFDVVVKQPIAFKANSGYVRFEAKISGPPCRYGEYGLSRIEHSGVVFSFSSSSCFNSAGQFPEFLFSLVW